jgi:hypothetical protein
MITRIEKKDPQAHEKVQNWRRGNQPGFVINLKTSRDATLHRTICVHLGDTEWEGGRKNWGTLGNKTKVCSRVKDELLRWSNENLKAAVKLCGSCKP